MLTWLRSNWKHLVTVAALIAAVASLQARARALGRAAIYEEQADSIHQDNLERRHQQTLRALAMAELQDSLETERQARQVERDARAEERAEERRAIEASTARAHDLAAKVRARLDVVGDSIFTEYVAERDARDASYVRVITTLEDDKDSLEADVASLALELAEERALSAFRLDGWNGALDEVGQLRGANAELHNAVTPSIFSRLWESKELAALFFVLGAVTWEVAR